MAFGHLYKEPGFFRQFFYSLLGSIGGVNVGCYIGYAAVGLPSFDKDPEAPFKLTEDHKAMITGIPCLAAILGSFTSAALAPRFGRKTIILGSQFPMIVGWSMFVLANHFPVFLTAAVLMGFFSGLVLPVGQLYLVEISPPKTRGFIAGTTMLWLVFYNLVNYSLGALIMWRWLALTNGVINIVYVALGAFAPESPAWLVARGQRGRAQKSLEMLGRCQTRKDLERLSKDKTLQESQALKSVSAEPAPDADEDERENLQTKTVDDEEKAVAATDSLPASGKNDVPQEQQPAKFAEIFHWANLKRILLISLFLILRQFTGAYAVVTYTVDIFQTADGAVDPNVGAIAVGIVQLVFVILANVATDKVGRKRLIVGSGVLSGVSQCVFGVYYFLKARDDTRRLAETQLSWVPLVTLMFFIAGFSLGIAPALYVFIVELVPFRIRNMISGWVAVVNSLANFFVVALYFKMKHGLTEAGTFWLYGGACFALAVYCALVLPETKGKVLEEMEPSRQNKAAKPNNNGDLDDVDNPARETTSKLKVQFQEDGEDDIGAVHKAASEKLMNGSNG